MADKGARSKPAPSCSKAHKVARRKSADIKMLSHTLIQKPKVQAQMVNQVDIRIAAAFQSTIGVMSYLYTVLPPEETSLVEERLIKLLLTRDSTLRAKVTEHAWRQLRASKNIYQVIDWTGLDIPVSVSQAVWQFHCLEKISPDEDRT